MVIAQTIEIVLASEEQRIGLVPVECSSSVCDKKFYLPVEFVDLTSGRILADKVIGAYLDMDDHRIVCGRSCLYEKQGD